MEEIDENTSMEDLQKMMVVALVYRVVVCVYEVRLTVDTMERILSFIMFFFSIYCCDSVHYYDHYHCYLFYAQYGGFKFPERVL